MVTSLTYFCIRTAHIRVTCVQQFKLDLAFKSKKTSIFHKNSKKVEYEHHFRVDDFITNLFANS